MLEVIVSIILLPVAAVAVIFTIGLGVSCIKALQKKKDKKDEI